MSQMDARGRLRGGQGRAVQAHEENRQETQLMPLRSQDGSCLRLEGAHPRRLRRPPPPTSTRGPSSHPPWTSPATMRSSRDSLREVEAVGETGTCTKEQTARWLRLAHESRIEMKGIVKATGACC